MFCHTDFKVGKVLECTSRLNKYLYLQYKEVKNRINLIVIK